MLKCRILMSRRLNKQKPVKTTRIPRGLANESQALPTRPTDQPCLGIPRRKLVEGMLSE